MKYRQDPNDFIVEEIATHNIQKKGEYKIFTLEKTGIDILSIFDIIFQTYHVPKSEIGIAGNKDTYAKTKQFITVPKKYNLESTDDIKITFLGFVNKPIRLGDLTGNKFSITVRDIKGDELKFIKENSKSVKNGIPNYYDSQRFGSVINKKFIGHYLVKKDFESAVKQFLTGVYGYDSDERKEDKEMILGSWPKFDIAVKSNDLREVINQYKKIKKWIVAYKFISPRLRLLFISSYQSHIWNECIKLWLKTRIENIDLYTVPYVLGEIVFNKKKIENIPQTFQTMSHKIKPEKHEEGILTKVLKKENVSISEFNIRQTGNFFKSQKRDIMIYPTNFHIEDPIKDGNTYKISLEFTLPKGSYATMVLKKIFEQ